MSVEIHPECPPKKNGGKRPWWFAVEIAAPQSVQRRLLIPLAIILLLLVGGFGATLIYIQQENLNQACQEKLATASLELKESLAEQTDSLSAIEDVLLDNADLIDAIRAQDRNRLFEICDPIFTQLRVEYGITHFYFHRPDRVNLLRVHKPEKRGDLINRFTAREAEHTGKAASGIELGPLGTFTLRVVRPIFDGDTLIGYLELGKEIEDILEDISSQHGIGLAVAIHKKALNRKEWESGMKMLSRKADWNRFPEDVLIYSSLSHFPAEAERFVDEASHSHRDVTAETAFDGKTWQMLVAPLADVSGVEVGDLLVFYNTSEAIAQFNRLFTMALGATSAILTALLGFLYVLLRRTDRGIQLRQGEMAKSEQRYRTLFESSRDAIMTMAPPDWKFISGNQATNVLFGVKDDIEFTSLGPWNLSPEMQPDGHSSAEKAKEMIEIGMRNGSHFFEWTHKRLDGEEFPATVLLTRMEIDGQSMIQATVRDITEQKQFEEKIRGLATVTEQAAEGIAIADLDGNIQFTNPAWIAIHGYEEELVGKPLTIFHTEEQVKTDVIPFNEEVKQRGYKTGEVGHVRKDGTTFPTIMTVTLLKDKQGKPYAMATSMRDITEQKRAEESLRESEERFRRFAMASSYGLAMGELNGQLIFANDAVLRMVDEESEESFTNKTFYHYYTPENAKRLKQDILPIVLEKGQWVGEIPLLSTKGNSITTEQNIFLIRDEQGEPRMIGNIITNVTERKRAEQQIQDDATVLESKNLTLKELHDAAKSANQAKSEFLANMSHEIRTPMTAILGFADVLLGEDGLEHAPPERVEAFKTIKRNGEHLLNLINDILDLSKVEAGRFEVECIACSPADVVRDVVSLMRVRADAKNLPLEIEYVGGIPETIQSDPTRLRQILINLIGNAIKFTEVGKVRLIARLMDAECDEPKMQFDVVDSGIGITEEQIDNLFKPFSQADSSITRKFGGTGLGLTISKRLADKLGGSITVASTPGEGSTFTVTVRTGPLDGVKFIDNSTEVQVSTVPDKKPAATNVKLDCRVLLAEDGPDNQRLIAFLLKKAGAEVTVADNGQIAHDKALAAQDEDVPFDVILMDMQMPIMDGYAATSKLREAGYTGSIIALTAHTMDADRNKCLAAGCDGFMSKPIERKELIATVAEFASQQEPQKSG